MRVPRPLLGLLALAVVVACAWIVVIPPLQGPDEGGHLSYVQKMVETGSLPFFEKRGAYGPSTEQRVAGLYGGFEPLRGNLDARPLWTTADVAIWRRADAGTGPGARADGGYDQAFRNPPLYYAYEAVPYVAGRSGSFFTRELLMRLANIPFLLIVVACVWLLAAEVFGGSLLWCVTATVPVALQPQLLNLTSVVNPDVALAAAAAALLLALTRVLARGLSRRRVLAVVGLWALCSLTQPRGLVLAVPAALALALAWRRTLEAPGRRRLAIAGATAVVLAAGAAVFWSVHGHPVFSRLRAVGSYVWQFYLPRAPGMAPSAPARAYGFREAFVDRFQGGLAQLEVTLPHSAEVLVFALTVAGLTALALAGFRRRAWLRLRRRWELVATYAAVVAVLVATAHLAAVQDLGTSAFDPVLTGRYLLPALAVYGVAIAVLVRLLPLRWQTAGAGAVVGGAVVLQLGSLGLLLTRFYA